jgi:helicase required for RNAi-mediated heterochromatin assembly 1
MFHVMRDIGEEDGFQPISTARPLLRTAKQKQAVRDYVAESLQQARAAKPGSWLADPEIPYGQDLNPTEKAQEKSQIPARPSIKDGTLPQNNVHSPWTSKQEYLRTHYEMLREDALKPLRDAIADVHNNPGKMEFELSKPTTGLYDGVYITGITFAPRGIATRIIFSLSRVGKNILWQQSKRLMSGSLVVLTPADDMFATKCVVATIAARVTDNLKKFPPEIDLYIARPDDIELDCQREWIMLEERAGFYEAQRYTLQALRKMMDEP